MNNRRELWIDCAKYFAIIAVCVDHTNHFLYQSQYIAYASYFSVELFILLAGFGAWRSFERRPQTLSYQFTKIAKLFLQYALATFIIHCVKNDSFDLHTYLSSLFTFSISAPFYFFFFFFQLLIVSPYLLKWCNWCNHQRMSILLHFLTLIALTIISSLCVTCTMLLPLHGAGKHLFGGTYLLVYYLGILFANCPIMTPKVWNSVKISYIFCISLPLWCLWIYLMKNNLLPFDTILSPYFGNGFSPPSFNLVIFGILSMFLFYAFFSLLEMCPVVPVKKGLQIIALLGKNTLYVFMYHLLIKDAISRFIPNMLSQPKFIRFVVFLLIITLPILVKLIIQKCADIFNVSYAKIQ